MNPRGEINTRDTFNSNSFIVRYNNDKIRVQVDRYTPRFGGKKENFIIVPTLPKSFIYKVIIKMIPGENMINKRETFLIAR